MLQCGVNVHLRSCGCLRKCIVCFITTVTVFIRRSYSAIFQQLWFGLSKISQQKAFYYNNILKLSL